MTSAFKRLAEKPILLLIIVNVLAGLLTYRQYGTAWDEPLFYSYADALGYAYSPKEWFSGHFDLYNSYGASADDHKNRGPAYLFLARPFVYGLKALGSDSADAWHLVNFLFFQLGIYLLYRFAQRWMSKPAAFFTAVFFSFQPLLWGHAFINPKDPPFLTFFLGAVCFGFEMVDALAQNAKAQTRSMLLAAFFLGIATSIRVLGPFAGLLVFLYFLSKPSLRKDRPAWRRFVLYGFASAAVMLATWPYLWENPIGNFFAVLRFMSDNPTQLGLLFEGEIYRANNLPLRYFPFMLVTTLTEPVIPLAVLGVMLGFWKMLRGGAPSPQVRKDRVTSLALVFLWFFTLAAYIFLRRPSMYDGIRHFLFILPPVFIFAGLAYEVIIEKATIVLRRLKFPAWATSLFWLRALGGVVLLLPSLYGILKLHPYEYTYYNFYIGGTSRAFRTYETDYWLTCYKDAVQALNQKVNAPVRLFVKREAYLAKPFAGENVQVFQLGDPAVEVRPGDYVLANSRTNDNFTTYPKAPIVIEISRVGAKFCTIRQVP
ncbi:MAG: glycosyltransferase family 39 protein [Anaerolineales bacterium]